MDDTQRSAFARDGYIIIPNAIPPAQLAALNAEYDAHLQDGKLLRYDERWQTADRHGNTYRGRRMWSQPYRDLIDNPVVLPVLRELLGDPKWGHAHPALPDQLRPRIRLDHDNIHYQGPVAEGAKPSRGNHLHGGPDSWHITAVYELQSISKGDGGFGALPVSSSFSALDDDRMMTLQARAVLVGQGTHMPEGLKKAKNMGIENWRTEWTDSPWSFKNLNWDQEVPVHRVEGQAGDCILCVASYAEISVLYLSLCCHCVAHSAVAVCIWKFVAKTKDLQKN